MSDATAAGLPPSQEVSAGGLHMMHASAWCSLKHALLRLRRAASRTTTNRVALSSSWMIITSASRSSASRLAKTEVDVDLIPWEELKFDSSEEKGRATLPSFAPPGALSGSSSASGCPQV